MSEIVCWRCGTDLADLSLPLARLDECPQCVVHLHVCRMCQFFDPTVTKSCREDDADEVRDKQSANFCDYFKVAPDAFDATLADADQAAKNQLDILFGAGDVPDDQAGASDESLENLFSEKKD